MAIEPSLYQAPQGVESLLNTIPGDIEVIIEDENGEVEEAEETPAKQDGFDDNLAEVMEDSELAVLCNTLIADYENDVLSRKEWVDTYQKGLQLLGLKYEERSEPWQGACGVNHPLLMESAVKFQSETIMETFPASGPVKAKIIGKETPEKKDAAVRVEADMNYELTERMVEYRPEHEKLLTSLCLAGNAFKKIYFDPSMDRQTAVFVPAEDLVVNYGATSLETAERVTHVMRKTKNEVRKLQVAGFYKNIELPEPAVTLPTNSVTGQKDKEQGVFAFNDTRHVILEMHVMVDLPGYPDVDEKNFETGIALPYVITIDKSSNTVLAIRRNWLENDPNKLKRQHFVHYTYVPGFGFYAFGLIHLIGGHAKSATSLTRQLIDAGTLSNLPGGLKAKGLRVKGDDLPIAPGEFRDVDLPSGAIKDNIMTLPYKEPSITLLNLLDKVVEDGRRFAAVSDLKLSDMSAQAPVGTTLAILERTLKVMSAVQARIHYAMKQEFKLLAGIIRDNTPDEYPYEPETGERGAKRGDYDIVEIIPVSDPNAATMSQKVVQYQAAFQMAESAPQIYDMQYLHRQMLEVLGIKNISKIIPLPDDMKPIDPVTENMNVLMGKPVKAFIHQDHEAHLMVHMAAIQDPKMQQIMGQNPQASLIQGAAMAHVMEHVAFQYRREIEKQLGAALPPMPDGDDNILPPEIEVQLSQLAARAADKLLKKDVAEAQMQQQAAMMQDPLIQMQMKELQIKEEEIQRKKNKDVMDAAAKADTNRIREQEITNRNKLDAVRIAVDAAEAKDDMALREKTEMVKLAADLAKTKDQMDMTAQNNAQDREFRGREAAAGREQGDRHKMADTFMRTGENQQKAQQAEQKVKQDKDKGKNK